MFVLHTSESCEGLHSTSITRLHRYAGLHPRPVSLCPAPFYRCGDILDAVQLSAKTVLARLVRSVSQCVARCCLRPRSGSRVLVLAPSPLLPASTTMALARSNPPRYRGCTTRFSVSRFTSQPLLTPCFSARPLGVEFPLWLFRFASRVPSYSVTRITHFEQHMGWLTTPFPEGFPPP